jgi:hypothetical protein
MSRTTLIEIQPRRPDGTVETLRLVDRSPRAAAYLGAQWLPLVTELPGFEMAIGFDGQRFGAQPSPQIGALAFALAPEIRAAAGWVWRDAPVTIRQADWPINGSNPADGAFATVWTGNAASFSSDSGAARVELIDKGQLLRVPVAPLRFGSTGIALLDAAAASRDRQAGQVVPVAFGRVLNLPGLLVDRANNIWLFAARAAASVQAFYDGGVAFTLGSARASLAALQGTSPAAGTVDWCLNAGGLLLARPADRPVYPFTCDATFGSPALGDVAFDIVGSRVPFAALPVPLNSLGLGDCGLYIDDETTVAEALDRLLAGLGIYWKVRTDGTIDARRLQWDTPVASFAAHQRHAPSRLQTILPTARRQLGYATNNRVHGEGEIARILLATDLAYADGTPIEALKPAEAGADVTGSNTSANSNALGGNSAGSVLGAIVAAQEAAADAQATADGKIDTFFQPEMPAAGSIGDLWIDSNDGNRLYRHNGTTFVLAEDQRIGAALLAAAGAQATADGKVRTFYGAATPVDPDLGDLWAIPGEQRLRRFNGAGFDVIVEFIANARTSFTLAMPASGSFTQIGIATLGVGPNGTTQISATIDYSPSPGFGAVSGAIELTVDWRPVPGTGAWTQIGGAQLGSTASRAPDLVPGTEPGDVTPGSVTIVRNLAGPASVANQEFRVNGRRTGTALSGFGTDDAVVSWVPV